MKRKVGEIAAAVGARDCSPRLLRRQAVWVESCLPKETRKVRKYRTPAGTVRREVIHRDWEVKGAAGGPARDSVAAVRRPPIRDHRVTVSIRQRRKGRPARKESSGRKA